VLTPHEGEFPRLFSDMSNKHPGRSNWTGCARRPSAPAPWSCSRGRIPPSHRPDGRATVAANAPPWLAPPPPATWLSGIIAGLLAQGVPAFEAPAWASGCKAKPRARPAPADRRRPAEVMPAVFRHLYDEFGVDY